MFSFFFFFFLWFLDVLICENEHLSQKQELGHWGICLFQALFPNLVSVGIARCSWYFRGLILDPGFSDVGQRPHSASLYRKSILGDLLLSLVRIQSFWRHFFPLSSNSSRSAIPLVTPANFWNDSYVTDLQDLSTCKGHEMEFGPDLTSLQALLSEGVPLVSCSNLASTSTEGGIFHHSQDTAS